MRDVRNGRKVNRNARLRVASCWIFAFTYSTVKTKVELFRTGFGGRGGAGWARRVEEFVENLQTYADIVSPILRVVQERRPAV